MGKNLRKYRHGSWQKSEARKRWSKKQGIRAEEFILRHWWIFVISRIRSWSQNIKSTKAESYSEVTLQKMILDLLQFSLNKDQQHHRWLTQKSWTLHQGYQDAQDRQRTQYPLTHSSNWKMHRRYWKFQSQNVQTFGFVYRNTNGQNHGPVWKTQLFLLICAVILWQDYYGNCKSKKLKKNGCEKVPNWECLFFNRERGLFLSVYVDDKKLAGKQQIISPTWKIQMKDVDLGEPTSFLDHVYMGCTLWECQMSKDSVE